MERNANYALVGLISTILLIAMIVFIFWLANFAFSAKYDTYQVVFHGPVSGLTRGGDVQFNGIKVGEVSDIRLDAQDPNKVIAYVRVRSDTPVRVDTEASLEPQGITGVNYIQLTAGTVSKPLLKDATPSGQPLVIEAKPGSIASLLSGGGTVMQAALDTLQRIDKVLSQENIQKVTAILSDVQAVTAELRERKAVIADADKALQDADQAAIQIKTLAKSAQGLVDTDGKKTLGKIDSTADEIQGAASDLRALMAKLKEPTSDFANNGLPEMTRTIETLHKATNDLDRLLNEVERDPRGFISKPPAKQIQVKP
jgi:phospholipid/cholesterol/gamma-HCH transport system substrate-binding protein